MITAETEQNIQSLVFTGFGSLKAGRLLRLMGITPVWLKRIFDRIGFGRNRHELAVQLLLTASGAERLGASREDISLLGREFEQGMTSPQSRQRLGDVAGAASEHWGWSDRTHEAVLLVYAKDHASLQLQIDSLTLGVVVASSQDIYLPENGREAFGFMDGLSNLQLDRPDREVPNAIPDGELLIGHEDAQGDIMDLGPLGKDSSFVAARELEQDVAKFWKFWIDAADGDAKQAVFLASKAMGRWPNGMPLLPDQTEEPAYEQSKAVIQSFSDDRQGKGCPFGSHVRRSHPRDTLGESAEVSRKISRLHRIMRRGRLYGPPAPVDCYPEPLQEPMDLSHQGTNEDARGLMFLCICADLRQQMEFIQQNWLNAPKHADLYNEVDPILAHGEMPRTFGMRTCSYKRYIDGVGGYVLPKGGAYYLLPSKSVLESLLSAADA